MSANDVILRFVQISDTHISHDEAYNRPPAPHNPLEGTLALLAALRDLPFTLTSSSTPATSSLIPSRCLSQSS